MGTPMGDIKAYGTPFVEPYDHFRGVPICGGTLNTNVDVPPLSYEVQRVVHQKKSGDEYKTRMEVSFFVDTDEIEVVDSRLADGSDSEEESTDLPLVHGLPLRGT